MRPLADEIRPQTLDEVAGQKHLLGEGALLRRLIENGTDTNLIFYGPSGTGKTTVANIIAKQAKKTLYYLNATTASLQDVKNVIGDVGGKDCILFDDMVDTAGSLCNAADAIKKIGGAKRVFACATHGLLSGPAVERIEGSVIEELVFLDTMPLPEAAKQSKKIKQISASDLFAEAIRRTYEEISLSNLF